MAIAPLNKFITIAVPVAPGEQTVYTAPTGVSSLYFMLLFQMLVLEVLIRK